MKRMPKLTAIGVVLLLIPAVMAPATGSAEAAEEGVRHIRLWQHLDAPEEPYFYELIDRFNEAHADIEVEFELIPWGGAYDLYTTSLVAGDAADVIFYATPAWGSAFWEMDVLEPLDEYIAEWPGADHIVDVAWEGSRAAPAEPIFGIPIMTLPGYLYYRADWFDELGLDPPETREDFLEAAQRITNEIDGAYGFGMRGARGGTGMMLAFILPTVGNDWFDADGRSTFRRPEAIEAARWYVDLFREHRVTPPSAPSDGFSEIIEGFQSGLTGMLVHHIMSAEGHVSALGGDAVGISKVPSVNGERWVEAGMHHYVISRNSRHKDAAFAFASWMAEPEQATFYGRYIGAIPVVENPEQYEPYFAENRFARTAAESTAFAYNPPYIETLGEFWEQSWPANFQRALIGDITVEQMMEEFATTLEGR